MWKAVGGLASAAQQASEAALAAQRAAKAAMSDLDSHMMAQI